MPSQGSIDAGLRNGMQAKGQKSEEAHQKPRWLRLRPNPCSARWRFARFSRFCRTKVTARRPSRFGALTSPALGTVRLRAGNAPGASSALSPFENRTKCGSPKTRSKPVPSTNMVGLLATQSLPRFCQTKVTRYHARFPRFCKTRVTKHRLGQRLAGHNHPIRPRKPRYSQPPSSAIAARRLGRSRRLASQKPRRLRLRSTTWSAPLATRSLLTILPNEGNEVPRYFQQFCKNEGNGARGVGGGCRSWSRPNLNDLLLIGEGKRS
jgi:hypothetical protein